MKSQRTWNWSAMALAAVAMVAFSAAPAWAAGGGHGGGGHGGGGMHGSGMHGGEGMHGGAANPHPYHPSQAHFNQHQGGPNNIANYNHHHDGWHNGYWGPGFWGGAAVGYGLGSAYAPWGWDDGGTYVDNSTTITPAYNDASYEAGGDASSAPSTAGSTGFPTDTWPELGISTYAGQYGGSQGQVVVRIVPGSAAAKAGFVPGDVILSVNGQPASSANALEQILESAQGQFSAEVWDARTGRKSTLNGNLDADAAPSQPAPAAAVSQN